MTIDRLLLLFPGVEMDESTCPRFGDGSPMEETDTVLDMVQNLEDSPLESWSLMGKLGSTLEGKDFDAASCSKMARVSPVSVLRLVALLLSILPCLSLGS